MGVLCKKSSQALVVLLFVLIVQSTKGIKLNLLEEDDKRQCGPTIFKKHSNHSPLFINVHSKLPLPLSIPKLPSKPPPLSNTLSSLLPTRKSLFPWPANLLPTKPKIPLLHSPIVPHVPEYSLVPKLSSFPLVPRSPLITPVPKLPLLPLIPKLPLISPVPKLPLLPLVPKLPLLPLIPGLPLTTPVPKLPILTKLPLINPFLLPRPTLLPLVPGTIPFTTLLPPIVHPMRPLPIISLIPKSSFLGLKTDLSLLGKESSLFSGKDKKRALLKLGSLLQKGSSNASDFLGFKKTLVKR